MNNVLDWRAPKRNNIDILFHFFSYQVWQWWSIRVYWYCYCTFFPNEKKWYNKLIYFANIVVVFSFSHFKKNPLDVIHFPLDYFSRAHAQIYTYVSRSLKYIRQSPFLFPLNNQGAKLMQMNNLLYLSQIVL